MRRSGLLLLLFLLGVQTAWGQALLKAWQPTQALEGTEVIRKVAVAADGSLVLILTGDNRIRVYDPVKKETLRRLEGPAGKVVALAGSGLKGPVLFATERALYAAPATGDEPPRKLWEGKETIYGLTSAPTRDFCAVATSEGAVIVNVRTRDVALSTRETTCLAAQFAPDEKTLALALGKQVVIYEVPTFVRKQVWPNNGFVYSLAYAPDSAFLAIGGEGNSLTLKRVADGQTMKHLSLGVSARQVEQLAFAGDQSGLFVATGRSLVVFDDLNQEQPASRVIKLEEKIHSLGFSRPAEALLAGTDHGRSLSVWGVTLPKPPEPLVAFETVRAPDLELLQPLPEAPLTGPLQELVFKVDSHGKEKVGAVRVLVDGRAARVLAADAPPGAKPESVNGVLSQAFANGKDYHFKVEVPSQDATLVILAETPFATSGPRVARLRFDQAAAPPPPRPRIQVVPPTLAILAPGPETSLLEPSLDLDLKAEAAPGQPITQIRILVDGVPASAAPTGPGPVQHYHLAMPSHDSTVVVIAETAFANSNPGVVKVRWKGEGSLTPARPTVAIVPPTLTLQEPLAHAQFKAGALRLALTLASAPEQEATDLKFFIDGTPVAATPDPEALPDAQGRLPHGRPLHFTLELPKKDCVLMVLAGNRYGTGNPVVLPLTWEGTAAQNLPPVKLLPPEVRILEPEPGARFKGPLVPVKLRLDGPRATALRVFVDGVPAEPVGLAPGLATGVPLAFSVPVPARDCTLLVLADNEAVSSAPTVLRLAFDAPPAPKVPERLIPPTVKILAPGPEVLFRSSEYLLALQVGSAPDQDIRKLRVFLDGMPLGLDPEPPGNGPEVRFRVPLPDRDCTLMVLAESSYRQSEPAVLRLRYDRPPPPPVPVRVAKPIVTILEPAPQAVMKAATVHLRVKVVTANDHPVSGLRVLVDGLPVEAVQERGLRPQQAPARAQDGEALLQQEVRSVTFRIPSRDCSVMVYADTAEISSEPEVLALQWEKKDLQTLPTLYLLAVGVSRYQDTTYALQFPAKDAKDFTTLMTRQKGLHYKDIKVRLLTDADATRDNVLDALDWLAGQVTQKDMTVVFLAGHGINHFATSNYYYLPFDAKVESPTRTMVSGAEVHAILDRLQGKRLLLMDTCHAGTITGPAQRGVGDMDKFIHEITQGGQGLVVFAASKGAGMSEEDDRWGNGAFTKALLEGLGGKAGKDANGLVTWKMIDTYITQRVKDLTGGKQQPTTTPTPDTPDFSLVVLETP